MQQFLKMLYKVVDVSKALTSFLGIVYAVFWFTYLVGFKFVYSMNVFLDPIANLTHLFVRHSFTFKGTEYDSTYIITAIMFGGIFFLLTKLNIFVEGRIETEAFKESIRKAQRDARVNAKVARVFKEHVSKIDHFVIYLNINLNYAINEILIHNKVDLHSQKNNNYIRIIENMNLLYTLKTEMVDGRLGIICDDFENFDKVFKEFLESLDMISSENSSFDIATEIYFIIDGIEGDILTDNKRMYLNKILSFGYKNKAVTTTIFAKRYEQEEKQAFTLNTMGKIRFFEDANKADPSGKHTDFELFTLRRKKV